MQASGESDRYEDAFDMRATMMTIPNATPARAYMVTCQLLGKPESVNIDFSRLSIFNAEDYNKLFRKTSTFNPASIFLANQPAEG
jgi:hypothetical protein